MPSPESSFSSHEGQSPHDDSFALPQELVEFLRDHEFACVTESTNLGTVIIIKLPRADIESIRGPVPIHLRHELFDHPASPVIRMVFIIYDQPDTPLALETFINVADANQRADYARLCGQQQLPMLFYDETVNHRLSKVIEISNHSEVQQIIMVADRLLAQTPAAQRDFDAAKSMVVANYPLV